MKPNIERNLQRSAGARLDDPQFAKLLKESFAPRPQDEAQQLTRQIMRRLPERRRRPVLTMLLAYIQSPFWLITAIILCFCIFALNLSELMERFDNPLNIIFAAVIISFVDAFLANDMLRDVEKTAKTFN